MIYNNNIQWSTGAVLGTQCIQQLITITQILDFWGSLHVFFKSSWPWLSLDPAMPTKQSLVGALKCPRSKYARGLFLLVFPFYTNQEVPRLTSNNLYMKKYIQEWWEALFKIEKDKAPPRSLKTHGCRGNLEIRLRDFLPGLNHAFLRWWNWEHVSWFIIWGFATSLGQVWRTAVHGVAKRWTWLSDSIMTTGKKLGNSLLSVSFLLGSQETKPAVRPVTAPHRTGTTCPVQLAK